MRRALAGFNWAFALALYVAATAPAAAQSAPCRQALALGLDVSGSVDAREYRLQLGGLAAALGAPEVRAALFALPGAPVHLLVYEWSGTDKTTLLVEWTAIDGPETLDRVRQSLQRFKRAETSPGTAIGHALSEGKRYLDQRAECWARTLDISGDGMSNLGPEPSDARRDLDRAGIVVNALVIGADAPAISDQRQAEIGELSSYFRTQVIIGDGAFVQTALGYEEYEQAMKRKLERELQGAVFSKLLRAPGRE